jgi:hypothetical protein
VWSAHALEDRSEEAVGVVFVRGGAEMGTCQRGVERFREGLACGHTLEGGMALEERTHLVLTFVRQHGAGGVHEAASPLHVGRGLVQDLGLERQQVWELGEAPPKLGVAPPDAGAGAWGVDEDPVEGASQLGGRAVLSVEERADASQSCPLGSSLELTQGASADVGGHQAAVGSTLSRDGQGLAACTCADIPDVVSWLHLEELDHQLAGFVLDL